MVLRRRDVTFEAHEVRVLALGPKQLGRNAIVRANDITTSEVSFPPRVLGLTLCFLSMYPTPLGLTGLTRTHLRVYTLAPRALLPIRAICSSARTATVDRKLKGQLTAYLHQQQLSRDPRLSRQQTNMSFLLPGLRRGLLLSTPLILSTPLLAYQLRNGQRIRCDGPDPLTKITNDLKSNYTTEAKTPVITQSGVMNPETVQQISMGSILGVIGGIGLSVFSRPLAILIGLGIFAVQVSSMSCSLCSIQLSMVYH